LQIKRLSLKDSQTTTCEKTFALFGILREPRLKFMDSIRAEDAESAKGFNQERGTAHAKKG
jgi:hypothetical protein